MFLNCYMQTDGRTDQFLMYIWPGCRNRSKLIMKKYKVKSWNDFTYLETPSEIYPYDNSHVTVVSI